MAETSTRVCQFVGDPKPDIAGVGILAGFSGQGLLSLILALWVFFFSRHGRLDMLHEEGSDEHEIEMRRLEMVRDILMIGNDIQLMTGVALMITGFASYKSIDLYHLRLIYDTVSFVGVSIAAALVCYTFCVAREEKYLQQRQRRATGLEDNDTAGMARKKKETTWLDTYFTVLGPLQMLFKWAVKTMPQLAKLTKENPVISKFFSSSRYRATYVFAVFYLALTILLNNKLGEWDLEVPGACYSAHGTSTADAVHPRADRIYVWVSFGWMMTVMVFSIFDNANHRRFILVAAFVQFPLHFYMMLALRSANQGLLGVTAAQASEAAATLVARGGLSLSSRAEAASEGEGTTENEWDFGQTTAILLLFVALFEAFGKGYGFFQIERQLKMSRDEKRKGETARPTSRGSNIEFDDLEQQDQGQDEQASLNRAHESRQSSTGKPNQGQILARISTISSLGTHNSEDSGSGQGTGDAINTSMPYDVEASTQPQQQQQHHHR
ncbi:hypothetical protein F503_05984 [Ophiostoma piceae UAMH 11346]|uniref:Uncharacterized protein n=1 Tax=Ophiostoma piceae (strain UAMH 11346) TaxID=1262450 RepID=S3CBK8_OPHP1|nr:hypothetical protein F503_05984 [Ophiostoma piceae UAMH 11346]